MSIKMTGTNPDPNASYQGPYKDPGLTRAGDPDPNQVSTAAKPDTADKLGRVTIYDAEGTNQEPGDQGAVTPPHSPTHWSIEDDAAGIPRSRDYYRNGGMIGQDFIDNQG